MANLELWSDRFTPRSLLGDVWGFLDEFDGNTVRRPNSQLMSVACDIGETKDHYHLSFDLPGVKEEDVNIEVTGRKLTVSGQRHFEKKSEDEGHIYRMERRFGSFQRVFDLPEGTDADSVNASFQNGVLEIDIPKAEVTKTKKITIGSKQKGLFKKLSSKTAPETAKASNA